ncbi:FAD-dependent monooxygenase [Streptomyces sp. NPDC050560]|uniref:FAD-dependent monooxygenase n=1 Tax=Streptomyces sp. NPDC050560 TaxID=3365630 RepID=UPI0037AA8EFD
MTQHHAPEAAADTGVVVAGGGPVGLLAAAELARFGARVLVVEPLERIARRPKAGTVHARAVQSLVRRGYLRGVEGLWPKDTASAFHYAGMPLLRITTEPGEPTALLKRAQADLEAEFERRLLRHGGRVLRGHRVTGVRQDATGVDVTVEGAGARTLRARYLVGADGAHGRVAGLAGITARTDPPTVSAMMGLARRVGPEPLPPGWHRTPRGWAVVRPLADGGALVRTLDTGHPPVGRDTAEPTAADLAAEVSRVLGRPTTLDDVPHASRFSDLTRVADRFRLGRVLLAGDAAHLHFPIGGQGMSNGVLDALNLAWKLARVLDGVADDGLLDTYESERRPPALRVVEDTRAQLALMREGVEPDALRARFTALLAVPGAQETVAARISGQDTAHPALCGRDCGREGAFLPNLSLTPLDGDRTGPTTVAELLADGRPLLVEGPGARGAGDTARVHGGIRVLRVAEPLPGGAVLLRPDGHIAWTPGCGDPGKALVRWFGQRR